MEMNQQKQFYECIIEKVPVNMDDTTILTELKTTHNDIYFAHRIRRFPNRELTSFIRVRCKHIQTWNYLMKNGCKITNKSFIIIKSKQMHGYNTHRCFNCQGINTKHMARSCTSAKICVQCAGQHDEKNCKSEKLLCANCQNSHRADSNTCPAWIKAKEISRRENTPASKQDYELLKCNQAELCQNQKIIIEKHERYHELSMIAINQMREVQSTEKTQIDEIHEFLNSLMPEIEQLRETSNKNSSIMVNMSSFMDKIMESENQLSEIDATTDTEEYATELPIDLITASTPEKTTQTQPTCDLMNEPTRVLFSNPESPNFEEENFENESTNLEMFLDESRHIPVTIETEVSELEMNQSTKLETVTLTTTTPEMKTPPKPQRRPWNPDNHNEGEGTSSTSCSGRWKNVFDYPRKVTFVKSPPKTSPDFDDTQKLDIFLELEHADSHMKDIQKSITARTGISDFENYIPITKPEKFQHCFSYYKQSQLSDINNLIMLFQEKLDDCYTENGRKILRKNDYYYLSEEAINIWKRLKHELHSGSTPNTEWWENTDKLWSPFKYKN